ncbi:MAG: hypothetical protein V3S89_13330 [Desulfobacterales bacterium]
MAPYTDPYPRDTCPFMILIEGVADIAADVILSVFLVIECDGLLDLAAAPGLSK